MLFWQFSKIIIYVKIVGKYQISIWMYGYSQIQRTGSKKDGELRDKSVSYFQHKSGPCPLNWRITIHSNVDLVFFQQFWHIWLCGKITRTTFQWMVVLQSRRQNFILVEARISEWNICWTNVNTGRAKPNDPSNFDWPIIVG